MTLQPSVKWAILHFLTPPLPGQNSHYKPINIIIFEPKVDNDPQREKREWLFLRHGDSRGERTMGCLSDTPFILCFANSFNHFNANAKMPNKSEIIGQPWLRSLLCSRYPKEERVSAFFPDVQSRSEKCLELWQSYAWSKKNCNRIVGTRIMRCLQTAEAIFQSSPQLFRL